VPDHFTPNKDIKAATQSKLIREFAKRHQIKNFWEVGRVGIEHVLLPEQGLVAPGDVVIGARLSHPLYLRRPERVCHRVGSPTIAAAMAWGRGLAAGARHDPFRLSRPAAPLRGRKDLMLHTIA